MLAVRRSSTAIGNSGVLPVLGMQSMLSTVAPSRAAASSAARASRDLPIPASPTRQTACPWPLIARSQASASRASAFERPTISTGDASRRRASKREGTDDSPTTRQARTPSWNPFTGTRPRSS